MSILDKIAEDNADLIKDDDIVDYDDEARSVLSNTVDFNVEDLNNCFNEIYKNASMCSMSRVQQSCDFGDMEMHQGDNTPDVWLVKNGKIIRTTPQFIKG